MKRRNLAKSIDSSGPDIWFDVEFRIALEQHLHFLRNDENITHVEVNPVDAEYYKGNFHGLLYKNNIPVYLHWIITRMNGLDSSSDFKETITRFIIPDVERVNRIREVFMTIHNI